MDETSNRYEVKHGDEFGKVAVLLGGTSAERTVSLKSGAAVLKALKERGVDAHGIDVGSDVMQILKQGNYDRAFIVLHGRGGEDGVIQGALETIGLPYTGSDVLGSALSMDKLRTKLVLLGAGMPTPGFRTFSRESDMNRDIEQLGFPLMVKPAREGSSIGMTKVEKIEQLQVAWQKAKDFDDDVFAEQWITGTEYTASILGGQALPLIRLETPRGFYDFEAKYSATDTRYICPCGLNADREKELQDLALKVFNITGCSGWGRVDLMCDKTGKPWILEVNSVPGMTDHSLVPMAARQAGISFEDLCWRILETSFERDKARA